MISGALAGLAGIIEVAGPVGNLRHQHFAGLRIHRHHRRVFSAVSIRSESSSPACFLALTFIGGEQAQIAMKIPLDLTKVFQGILLFFVLACDSLIVYRIRLMPSPRRAAQGIGHGTG